MGERIYMHVWVCRFTDGRFTPRKRWWENSARNSQSPVWQQQQLLSPVWRDYQLAKYETQLQPFDTVGKISLIFMLERLWVDVILSIEIRFTALSSLQRFLFKAPPLLSCFAWTPQFAVSPKKSNLFLSTQTSYLLLCPGVWAGESWDWQVSWNVTSLKVCGKLNRLYFLNWLVLLSVASPPASPGCGAVGGGHLASGKHLIWGW